ncbi:MAG: A/G-specific adenine glycosylase [Acidobacteriaceae bacterium]
MTGEVLDFRAALLGWYGESARDLPWRRTRDAYVVWVSEMMLQQTRVAAAVEYFERFLKAFPTMEALAAAEEDAVLAQWSGLGYYRRARMMHRAAQLVVAERGGRMPETSAELRELPGIGEYTAAAVASISFGEAVPVVDGNVERVLLRMYGPGLLEASGKAGAKILRETAGTLLDGQRPGDFNQAMMELGAMVCTPKGPVCMVCPVRAHCRTQGEHGTGPAKPMRSRSVGYVLMVKGRDAKVEVLLRQRGDEESQMPGMWELPGAPEGLPDAAVLMTVRHAITNTNYSVTVFGLDAAKRRMVKGDAKRMRWVQARALEGFALTGLARKVLKRAKIL